ncbi:hypothetical protein AD18_3125 [Escherichia coli 3-475-03_S4_C2]|nr:hypothetical protein AB17_2762 [Escherichia coli 3-105-05_S1_C1]KDU56059.1 hypothetical protein AD18_3125 [Escherichia coli 3-475-03_S4_C2]KDZ90049.1 hypothetical protein AB75_2822 [Escherichia coli 3-105-05_S1_C3]
MLCIKDVLTFFDVAQSKKQSVRMTGATALCKFFNEFAGLKINKNNMLTDKTPE